MMVLSTDSVKDRENPISDVSLDDDHLYGFDEHFDGRSLCVQDGFCYHSYSGAQMCRNCNQGMHDCSCKPEPEDDDDYEQDVSDSRRTYQQEDEEMQPVRRPDIRFQEKRKCANKRKLPLGTICGVSENPVRWCHHCRRLAENRQCTRGLERQRGRFGGDESRVIEDGEEYKHAEKSWKKPLQRLRNRQQRYEGRLSCRRSTAEVDDTGYPAHGTYVEDKAVMARWRKQRYLQLLYGLRTPRHLDDIEPQGTVVEYSKDTHYRTGNAQPGLCRKIKTQGETKVSRQKRLDALVLRNNQRVVAAAEHRRMQQELEGQQQRILQQVNAIRKGRCYECLRAMHRHRPSCTLYEG